MAVRIRPENIGRTLKFIEKTWQEIYPQDPFTYSFLDEDFDHLYRAEHLRGRVFLSFSALTILIACLGLFGLASFTAEQKTREIGIRKVLGASPPSLVRLLTKEFIKLVFLASLISWPVAYFIMRSWLGGFAYRISIGPAVFFMATILAVVVALLTVGYQAVKAALSNPVDAIRMN
jgi:ABC-type antimicrobial peptide transport system permease subunit